MAPAGFTVDPTCGSDELSGARLEFVNPTVACLASQDARDTEAAPSRRGPLVPDTSPTDGSGAKGPVADSPTTRALLCALSAISVPSPCLLHWLLDIVAGAWYDQQAGDGRLCVPCSKGPGSQLRMPDGRV